MYSRAYVEITNICNRSCSFCPGHKREPIRMTEQEFSHICEEVAKHTKYIYYHLMGEPLTHPNLPEFIRIANERELKSIITTNGTLLSRVGERLISAGAYKVNISLHSFEEGSEEEYKQYLHDCFSFADKASREGVLVIFRLWNKGADGGRNVDILNGLKEYFKDGEWKNDSRGARIRHKLHLEYGDRFKWPDAESDEKNSEIFCYGLADHFAILCDGSVVPCCLDRNGDITLGNIFENSLENILSSKRAENIREGFRKRKAFEKLCLGCTYAKRFK